MGLVIASFIFFITLTYLISIILIAQFFCKKIEELNKKLEGTNSLIQMTRQDYLTVLKRKPYIEYHASNN